MSIFATVFRKEHDSMLASQNELAPRKRRNEQITIHKEYAHPTAQTSPLWIVAVQGQFWEWLRLALSNSNKYKTISSYVC